MCYHMFGTILCGRSAVKEKVETQASI